MSIYNKKWSKFLCDEMQHVYDTLSASAGKASDCIGCRKCEKNCPQKLEITSHLTQVSKTFEH